MNQRVDFSKKHRSAKHLERLFAFGFLLILFAVAIGSVAQNRLMFQTPGLRVWFFDVGQGDAIFVETESGKQMLIDTGPSDVVLQKLGEVMWPWDRSIDALVLTHPDADHIAGTPGVLDRYQIGQVYESGLVAYTAVAKKIKDEEQTNHIPVSFLRAGGTFEFGGVHVDVLWPRDIDVANAKDDRNEASIVLKLTYQDTTVLLTGDAPETAEQMFAAQVGHIDVLKVGHHGSVTSTSNELLDAIQPTEAIVSVGKQNRYGHPHPLILERLRQHHTSVLQTMREGDILLWSNGKESHIEPHPLLF